MLVPSVANVLYPYKNWEDTENRRAVVAMPAPFRPERHVPLADAKTPMVRRTQQALMPGEIVHGLRRAVRLDVAGRRAQIQHARIELGLDQPGIEVREQLAADREIEAIPDEVDHAIGQLHADAGPRVFAEKSRHQRHHEAFAIAGRTGHAQPDGHVVADPELREDVVAFLNHAPAAIDEQMFQLGEAHPAGVPIEEPRIEPVFESCQRAAHLRGRNPQPLRRMDEAAGLGDGEQFIDAVPVVHGTIVVPIIAIWQF